MVYMALVEDKKTKELKRCLSKTMYDFLIENTNFTDYEINIVKYMVKHDIALTRDNFDKICFY